MPQHTAPITQKMDLKRLEALVGRSALDAIVVHKYVVVDFGNCRVWFYKW